MASDDPLKNESKSSRMLWLVIGIPALTVAGCMLTIYIALSNPDETVSDYKIRNDTGLEAPGTDPDR